jgi:hypothetical protein
VLVNSADALDRHAIENRRRRRIDADVGIDPDDSLATGDFRRTENEALLPCGAAAPRALADIERFVEDDEFEAVPPGIGRPVFPAVLFEAVAVVASDRQRDDRLAR